MQDDIEAVCAQLLNQLVLLAPPSFIYAAKPPVAATRAARAGRQHRPGGGVDDNDEEQATVYGSYAAVTLCDCRCKFGKYQPFPDLVLRVFLAGQVSGHLPAFMVSTHDAVLLQLAQTSEMC